jgi:hypothetical protein
MAHCDKPASIQLSQYLTWKGCLFGATAIDSILTFSFSLLTASSNCLFSSSALLQRRCSARI